MIKPLLAHVYEPHRVTYPCYVQPKLNGVRALYQGGRFQSRDGLPFPKDLLRHLAEPLMDVFGDRHHPLDGELYVHGWSLQRILGAITPVRTEEREDTALVEYHVFDQVYYDKPFEERMLGLNKLNWQTSKVKVVLTREVFDDDEANAFYATWVAEGFEGMMYRLGDCPYTVPKQEYGRHITPGQFYSKSKFLSDQDNRCWHLLKRKDFCDDEFEILDFRTTVGEKGGRGFVITCRAKTAEHRTFEVASGLTSSQIDHYLSESPVGRLARVKYLVLSDAGIPTGNPVILAIL